MYKKLLQEAMCKWEFDHGKLPTRKFATLSEFDLEMESIEDVT